MQLPRPDNRLATGKRDSEALLLLEEEEEDKEGVVEVQESVKRSRWTAAAAVAADCWTLAGGQSLTCRHLTKTTFNRACSDQCSYSTFLLRPPNLNV